MKKNLLFFLFFILSSSPVQALTPLPPTPTGYVIENFNSNIDIQKDTSLLVTETISANFSEEKHGIFRIIPIIYSAYGKTIKAYFNLISVTDDKNIPYQFETSRLNQSTQIKIGDPALTITGKHIYVIKYKINRVLLRYRDYDEVYWNVTGHEWDTIIAKASVTVNSPFAKIDKVDCFAGTFRTTNKFCTSIFSGQQAVFTATNTLGNNKDFTIVVGLNKTNNLAFPGPIERFKNFVVDNLDYAAALVPFLIMFFIWFKKGRDKRYLSPNVYYQPENQATETVPLFSREQLPMAYSPIKNITPAQVGTIIDGKVDIQDVVAEIVELGRLGYLDIQKTGKDDYLFINKNKDPEKLKDYQKYLYESLFDIQVVSKKLGNSLEDIENNNIKAELTSALDEITKQKLKKFPGAVLLSSLENQFYNHLEEFKNKLYSNLSKEKIFSNNPRTAKGISIFLAGMIVFFGFTPILIVSTATGNPFSFFLYLASIVPVFILAVSMPSRTAWGYSLNRQAIGLKYFIEMGKWREEIAEKNLFLEEILPLAICLGVVDKLTKDMADLGINPPQYFHGIQTAAFYSSFNSFQHATGSNLTSVPAGSSWSGKSSWSGGSGFSGGGGSFGGGSSGGGFGGGGGGSW